jgi:hypothetical protein
VTSRAPPRAPLSDAQLLQRPGYLSLTFEERVRLQRLRSGRRAIPTTESPMDIEAEQRVTLHDYWMGRDLEFPLMWSMEIRSNASRTVMLANELLELAANAGVHPSHSASGFGVVNSGWRPPAVNQATAGAARASKHLSAQAVDLDDDGGALDNWLLGESGQLALMRIGLWMEHPAATKGWCHIQTIPPASGNRVFYP